MTEDLQERTIQKEKCGFNAEVHKVLNLVINHIYTNQDIFLRELISNASDALDKLRHLRLTGEAGNDDADEELKIQIKLDKENKTIIIHDNGVGMSKEELRENLGTIAKSGTKQFFEALDQKKGNDLIGQFGVGFYSAFIVSDHVQVVSRKHDSDDVWIWDSDGKESFELSKYEGEEEFRRGTRITLHIKDASETYCDRHKVERIINTYSDHVKFPIELFNDKGDAEKINDSAALWTNNRDDITAEQHSNFFKAVAKVGGEPWLTLHNKNEGMIEFTNLLYVPSIKPYDLFNPERRCAVKLYVKRVFITEDNANIVPRYMRFIRGVVDSEDLPLNISRETLQENSIIDRIRNSLTNKILAELNKKMINDREDYLKFWDNFGAVLKEGLCEAMDNQSRKNLLDVCLFRSLNEDKLVSLDEYIEKKKEHQTTIFYITGNDLKSLKESPQLEGFVRRDIDVLLLTDNVVDDLWTHVVQDYKTVRFQSVTDPEINLNDVVFLKDEDTKDENDDESAEEKQAKEDYHMKIQECFKEVLGDRIGRVVISKKLTKSPICLVSEAGKMNARMERFMMEQNQLHSKTPKVLEVNANHAIVKKFLKKYEVNPTGEDWRNAVLLLFTQACMLEGETLDDPANYAKAINSLLEQVK